MGEVDVTQLGIGWAIAPPSSGRRTSPSVPWAPSDSRRSAVGGWFEVSQRADLAGSLARVEGPVLGQDEIRAIR
jgi:hypothetical protein